LSQLSSAFIRLAQANGNVEELHLPALSEVGSRNALVLLHGLIGNSTKLE